MRKEFFIVLALVAASLFSGSAWASRQEIAALGEKAVAKALKQLDAKADGKDMACLTNAGWVKRKGESTRILLDVIAEKSGITLGKNALLPVHSKFDDELWFAFIQKKSKKEIRLTYLTIKNDEVAASEVINVYINKKQSFEPFKKVMGKRAFSIVTLANAWVDGFPDDLLSGSLFHDHFCCGVATGYFTTRFMERKIPLADGEKYTYIGAPGWCQDDYIMSYLNLTPGKHGYYIMEYPWWRPWKTADKVYTDLGGVVICFDHKKNKGKACVLKFDWHWKEFKAFLGLPDAKLDWMGQPWLHAWYNRYLIKHMDNPEKFLSIHKEAVLETKQDFDNLVSLGENPLQEILGIDKTWNSTDK